MIYIYKYICIYIYLNYLPFVNIFVTLAYITITLKFYLENFTALTNVAGPPPDVAWIGSPVELDFKIGVINNYSNDRETYMKKYQDAYSALTKVPELSEWQT